MSSLSGRKGKAYWRSLTELSGGAAFRAHAEREFPFLGKLPAADRRQFLKLMGASLALGGLTGCRWPRETIVPYAKRPNGRVPGVPVYFASTVERGGVGLGVLVKSYDGRPLKIEGSEAHPDSLGATDAFTQAAVLEMYDPDRSTRPVERAGGAATPGSWQAFDAFAARHFAELKSAAGAGLCVLSQASFSPTLTRLRQQMRTSLPRAQWFEYEPLSRDNEHAGTKRAFGKPYRTILDFDQADVIAAFDDDFLLAHPAAVRYTRGFARQRTADGGKMNRLYVVEGGLSLTGSNADQRYPTRPSRIGAALVDVARALAAEGLDLPAAAKSALGDAGEAHGAAADVAKDLLAHRGHGAITVGPRQPAEVHALAALLNGALGNVGHGVRYVPVEDRPSHVDALASLAAKMAAGEVRTLLILGGNPVYDAPVDLEFARKLESVPSRIHLSLYDDETSRQCTWHVPMAHVLEAWGDARGWDGTVSFAQPLIEPLYGGRTPIELVAALLAGGAPANGFELVRETFQAQFLRSGDDFESAWRRALHDGVLPDSAWPAETPRAAGDWGAIVGGMQAGAPAVHAAGADSSAGPPRPAAAEQPPRPAAAQFEVVFAEDYSVYDGRYANNGWLQEKPDPLTKLTWDNAALLSPNDARRLRVAQDDRVEVAVGDRRLTLPVYVLPGQADGVVTLPLGYGRSAAGIVASGSGVDTYSLRASGGWHSAPAHVTKARGRYELATTQDHHSIRSAVGVAEAQRRVEHNLFMDGTLAEYKANPRFAQHKLHSLPLVQLFGDHQFPDAPRWAMAIDLSKCTGCSACVVACQAENNIAVVGKEEVMMGREMHWLRIDRYFQGDPHDAESLQVAHQPIVCQHCENAPCEQVCPVAATVHDEQGLNVMVYNRCIGTRYCLNNCPYKVRRFNFFYNHYGPQHPRSLALGTIDFPNPFKASLQPQIELTPIEKLRMNPDVTVRSRGVMEKCTFCVQRLAAAKIDARNREIDGGDRTIPDGTVRTACQQVCPADAITFGDLKVAGSRVAESRKSPRSYALLAELNVRPRNEYLAKLRNPLRDAPPAAPAHASCAGGGAAAAVAVASDLRVRRSAGEGACGQAGWKPAPQAGAGACGPFAGEGARGSGGAG